MTQGFDFQVDADAAVKIDRKIHDFIHMFGFKPDAIILGPEEFLSLQACILIVANKYQGEDDPAIPFGIQSFMGYPVRLKGTRGIDFEFSHADAFTCLMSLKDVEDGTPPVSN